MKTIHNTKKCNYKPDKICTETTSPNQLSPQIIGRRKQHFAIFGQKGTNIIT
jgi:hypothetical protein